MIPSRLFLSLSIVILFPFSSRAETVMEFTGDSGTDEFSDPESWKEGKIPGPEDTAKFSLPGSYTVTFTEDVEIDRLRLNEADHAVEPDVVTLNLNGHSLRILTEIITKGNQWPIVLTASSQSARTLKIEGGSLRFNGIWEATFIGKHSTIFILDKGMKVEGSGLGYVGAYGNGEAYIQGGSQWISESNSWAGVIGHAGDANGLLEISGKGSSFSAVTEEGTPPLDIRVFFISTTGNGTLRIWDGGSFACDMVNMGNGKMAPKTFSTLVVDGAGSTFSADVLNVGGGTNKAPNPATPAGNALVALSNGGIANVGALKVFSMEGSEGRDAAYGRVVINGGTLNLGVDTENLLSEFLPGSLLELRLRNIPEAPGINTPGELRIEGARLQVTLDPAFRAKVGDHIPLIDADILTGTFADLPEGSTIEADGYSFALTYELNNAGLVGLKVTAAKP